MKEKQEYEKVIAKIVRDIKEGTLAVGDKLPTERALAAEVATSRNSVREALRILESMGMLDTRQGSGNYISGDVVDSLSAMLELAMDLKKFSKNELFRFRMNMDKVICAVLIEKTTGLDELANRAEKIFDEPAMNVEEENEQDRRFHNLLIEATENRLLILMMESASSLFAEMIASVREVSDEQMKEKLLKAHKAIAQAIRSRNREQCDRAIEKHYKIVDEIVKKARLEEYLENRVYNQLDCVDPKQEIDPLTGLYYKTVFFRKAEEYIAEHPTEDLMLWSADIQGLRYVNEKYGMEMGDRVIAEVAGRGRGTAGFIFGGRIGGDKFCTLVKDDHADFTALNRVMIEELDAKLPVPNIAVKNGIYHIKKNDPLSAHAMYGRSVLALQSIKNSYSTMIVEYDDSMREELLNSKQIEADAKESLKNHEFSVFMQPKIDLAKNQVAGAEALIRWIHPELGFLSPGIFIPIFEKNGFIVNLDFWVWEEVCKTLTRWKREEKPLIPISVNVSRNSFEDSELATKIIALVDSYELEHSLFEIEVTEYSCLNNIEKIQNTIKQLHDAGFVISLDDFGTGYSSMVVLSKLEIDVMKLDMSLIKNDDSSDKRSALEFALQLAEMMQMKTVAEGIETEQQVERIRTLGGDFIQGYYYSKPLAIKDFEEYLLSHL